MSADYGIDVRVELDFVDMAGQRQPATRVTFSPAKQH